MKKRILALVLTILYIVSLFFPTSQELWFLNSGWLNGWQLFWVNKSSSILLFLVLLMALFSAFFFRKLTLGLLYLLLAVFLLKFALDYGALYLPTFDPKHAEFSFRQFSSFVLGIFAIMAWIVVCPKNKEIEPANRENFSFSSLYKMKLKIIFTVLYVIAFLSISNFQFFKLSLFEQSSLANGSLTPFVAWRLFLVLLILLIILSSFRFRWQTFPLSIALLGIFIFRSLYDLLGTFIPNAYYRLTPAEPVTTYLIELLGVICLFLWVRHFYKNT